MSGAKRQRDNLAPSLFPFLAVLLCTMGSLVLILMLIVADAQGKAQEVTRQIEERQEEVESLAEAKIRSQQQLFEDTQFELEKKRLSLQHFEQHIAELRQELQEIEQNLQIAESQDEASQAKAALQEQMTELEEQLAKATEDLKQQLEKPTGDKPVFAVIPYKGPNGTHRRPIYLECTRDGIRIQPEGVILSMDKLQPPYGPGNPLDAALRTIRSEFKPESGAITETAYPLLLVRPSGIHAYARARAALGGWDDQFGYELVDEELELVFPKSVPGLADKVVQSIELAVQRQAALVMAMPNKYQRLDGIQEGSSHTGWGGSGGGMLGGSNRRATAGSGSGATGSYGGDSGGTGARLGEISSSHDPSQGSGFSQSLQNDPRFGEPSMSQPGPRLEEFADSGGTRGDSFFGASGSAGETDGEMGGANSPSAPDGQATGHNASGQSASAQDQGSQQLAGQTGDSASGNAAAAMMGAGMRMPGGGASSQEDENTAPGMPQIGLDLKFGKEDKAAPVAAARGRNWAWRDGPKTQTPVVRSVYLHCFKDRWILLPDDGDPNRALTIMFTGSPEDRAVKLAEAIVDRVDSWGLALTGGYWKPTLAVDVAPDADWRFRQLQRLMESSGIEVQRRVQTADPRQGGLKR